MRLSAAMVVVAVLLHAGVAPGNREADSDAVREAVFRYMFVNNASGLQSKAEVFCLAISAEGKQADPSTAFLGRFTNLKQTVRAASECEASAHDVVRDRQTGKPALMFWTKEIRWTGDLTAEIAGGYDEGPMSASVNTYYLSKQGGIWRVVKDVMEIIV